MANYKGHLVGGVVAYGVLFFLTPLVPTAARATQWLLWCLAGSLFPDVDVKSKGHNLFYLAMLPVLLFLIAQARYQLAALLSVGALLPLIAQHRGLFHRLWFLVLIAGALLLVLPHYTGMAVKTLRLDLLFFLAGAISHLWLDLGIRKMFQW
jgi:hypothetical protein